MSGWDSHPPLALERVVESMCYARVFAIPQAPGECDLVLRE